MNNVHLSFSDKTAELDDSLNKSKEDVCYKDSLNSKISNGKATGIVEVSSEDIVEEYNDGSMPTLMLSSSETSSGDNLSRNILNLTMEDKDQTIDCRNTFLNLAPDLNNKITENITVSSDGTARFFSCDSSNNQNTIETQSLRSQSTQHSCEIFHEAVTFNNDNINATKNSFSNSNEVNSTNKVGTEKNRFSLNLMSFDQKGN